MNVETLMNLGYPLKLKNTFISVAENEEDEDDEWAPLTMGTARRQISDPTSITRHFTDSDNTVFDKTTLFFSKSSLYEQEDLAENEREPTSPEEPEREPQKRNESPCSSEDFQDRKADRNINLPLMVKNTFIDVDPCFIEEDFEDSLMQGIGVAKRQFSEPVPSRQIGISPVSTPSQLGAWGAKHSFGALTTGVSKEAPRVGEKLNAQAASWHPMSGRGVYTTQLQETDQTWMQQHEQYNMAMMPPFAPGQWPMAQYREFVPGQNSLAAGPISQSPHPAAPIAQKRVAPPANAPPVPASWGDTLTVMMRNLPNKYTQEMLIEEIQSRGFGGLFDFLYLPIDRETGANKGYAFINFVDTASSWLFKCTFEGKKMSSFNSTKHVSVAPATLQGFEANYVHYSDARVTRGDPGARPVFLRDPKTMVDTGANARRRRRRGGRSSLIDMAAQRQGVQEQTHLAPQPALHTPRLCNAQADDDDIHVVPTVKFCPYCGGNIGAGYQFCQFCGASLKGIA